MSGQRDLAGALYRRLPAWMRRARLRLAPGDAATRAWIGRPEDSAAYYWDSLDRPHRVPLLDVLAEAFPDAQSLLEVGANSGPNLRLAALRFPAARLGGIDVDPVAVAYGQERFDAELPGRVTLRVGAAQSALAALADGSEDVVFSVYALAYLSPRELRGMLTHALRVAHLGLVLAEPQPGAHQPAGLARETLEWRHDLPAELCALGIEAPMVRVQVLDAATVLSAVVVDLRPATASPR